MKSPLHLAKRRYWLDRIEEAWRKRPILWLSGVRRSGKTTLCQTLPGTIYFDCELPSTRRQMEDPESFLDSVKGQRIILDEIHRLPNPSELLKIAADHHPNTRVLATGSSTLGASTHFRDTLTGRKTELWLTPMMSEDLTDFGGGSLQHRLLHGGLPSFFMEKTLPESDFQEWMDSFWAKDIQDLFRVERRHSFVKFFELLMTQSGGIFEASRFAKPCEVSRPTITNYLRVLEATFVIHVIAPFNSRRATEIVAAPKTYAFDTGFCCYFKGWRDLRKEDLGILWEHYVLNELFARSQTRSLRYWRDKQGHEVDFIWSRRGAPPVAIECKWSSAHVDVGNLMIFRKSYPKGENYVVCQDVNRPFAQKKGDVEITFLNLTSLLARIGY